jgi:hypothetical protein
VVFALALLSLASAAHAQCPIPPPAARNPSVRLSVREPKLIYRHDLDLFGLSTYENTFERAPKGWIILGVTRRNEDFSVRTRLFSAPSTDGRTCVYISGVDAILGGADMDVYVAANYPVGSCEYNTVRDHENQHVAINTDVLVSHAPLIGAALRGAVHRLSPMIGADLSPERLNGYLFEAVRPAFDAMNRELVARNGAIDTPENYRRTSALCKNWFPAGTKMPDGAILGGK